MWHKKIVMAPLGVFIVYVSLWSFFYLMRNYSGDWWGFPLFMSAIGGGGFGFWLAFYPRQWH